MWTGEDQKELDDLREYNRKEGEILSKCCDKCIRSIL